MTISHVENCDNMVFMGKYPDKFFDLAIVDPPYGIGEDGRKNHTRSNLVKSSDYRNYSQYDDGYPDKLYFDELFRVSKNQIIWGANHYGNLPAASNWIIWNKVNGDNDFADCELAYTSFPGAARMFTYMWAGMMQGKSAKEGHIMQGNKKLNEKRIHPNQKPIILYQWIYHNYLFGAKSILDTHLGSGNNRIVADEFGVDFYGCEKDPGHFINQEKNFNQYKSQQKLF